MHPKPALSAITIDECYSPSPSTNISLCPGSGKSNLFQQVITNALARAGMSYVDQRQTPPLPASRTQLSLAINQAFKTSGTQSMG